MSDLTKQSDNPGDLTPEQIKTLALAGVIPANTPTAVVSVFATVCKQHGLSPFLKEIYLVEYGKAFHTVVGIDGMRKKAARTGQHAGTEEAIYDRVASGQFRTVAEFKAKELPKSCTVTVYRTVGGVRCPFTATVAFAEFYPAVVSGQGGYSKAASMPFNMIAKVAEAKALKMAFGDEFSGLHIEDEKAAFEGATVTAATLIGRPTDDPARKETLAKIAAVLQDINDVDGLGKFYAQDPLWKNDADVTRLFTARKNEILK